MTKADLLKYIDERLTQRSDGNIGLLMVRQYVADNMEDYHVQPTQKNESNTLEALDCVSRKAAIAEFSCCELTPDGGIDANYAIDFLKYMPSAQREIIRCKDCKYRFVDGENVRFNVCELNHNKVQSDDWFCADGERRADETD